MLSPPADSYAIFPYLRTSEPVQCCGLTLRSSRDLKGLTGENRAHLKKLLPMFFLGDHFRIREMTYAILPASSDDEVRQRQARALWRARTLMAYLYGNPDKDGQPFYRFEHASCCWMMPGRVSRWSLGETKRAQDLWPSKSRPTFDEWHCTDGYHGVLNANIHLSAVPGSRLYPPAPGIYLNHNQDLFSDLLVFDSRPYSWALEHLFEEEDGEPTEISRRAFNALEWYNRASALNISEDVALLNLAVALECLLNLEPGEGVTRRFKETITTLLGPVPRLDSWLEQFYTERSRIVHDGGSPHLEFYPVDNDKKHLADARKEKAQAHGWLSGHARRVFRLCLQTILSGALMAQEANLAGSMVPNDQRLQRIVRALDDTSHSPLDRLLGIRRDVVDLNELWGSCSVLSFSTDTEVQALCAAANQIAKICLDLSLPLPDEVRVALETVVATASKTKIARKLRLLDEAAAAIKKWKGDTPFHWRVNGARLQMDCMREDPSEIMRAFFDYASLAHHRLGRIDLEEAQAEA